MTKWWRPLFFYEITGMRDAEPLPVNWPAGDAVFTLHVLPCLVAWCHDNKVIGLSNPTIIELRGNFPTPVLFFSWPDVPLGAFISSVKIDGVEQLLQPKVLKDVSDFPKFGISGALFQRQSYTDEYPRRWWAWMGRWLWKHDAEDDEE